SEESEKFGPVYVRNKLLSELLKREVTASDVHGLQTFIKRRLKVGSLSQLRDRHALSGKVDEIYEVAPWKLKDSLKLFSLAAFKQSHPRNGYQGFSERAVEYAGVQEDYNDRGKRSRLMNAKDILDVLRHNKGADAIEGIIFDLSQKVDLRFRAGRFNLMSKLRFLKFHIPSGKKRLGTVHLPENIMPFLDKLTYLEWNGYPLKSLPQPFRAEQLIQICLPHSKIQHLWCGVQELVNLEAIDLSECKQLINFPDLFGVLKLKHLRLSGCENLCEVQASAFSKDTLDTLLLDRCTKWQSPMGEKHLKSLANFNVKGCSSLQEFSLSSNSITGLDLSNTGIEILHPSIGGMNKLSWLNLEDLNLTNLPIELSRLRSLTELRTVPQEETRSDRQQGGRHHRGGERSREKAFRSNYHGRDALKTGTPHLLKYEEHPIIFNDNKYPEVRECHQQASRITAKEPGNDG
ncbi:disease resistance protein, partial [Trifolium medium]|nr:disease resistance protein [Trifolium medium]